MRFHFFLNLLSVTFFSGLRLSSVVGSLFAFWQFEVNIVSFLALFVILARTHLSTVLRFTICILEAPVTKLKVTPLSIAILTIFHWVVGSFVMVQAFAHVIVRVCHFAAVAIFTVDV